MFVINKIWELLPFSQVLRVSGVVLLIYEVHPSINNIIITIHPRKSEELSHSAQSLSLTAHSFCSPETRASFSLLHFLSLSTSKYIYLSIYI